MANLTQTNEFDINGKVLFVGLPHWISDRMSKRLLVMEVYVEAKFKQEVPFEFVNDNMSQLNNVREGDWVTVSFRLRGRKNIQKDGKARWFPSNEGYYVNVVKGKNEM